MIDYVLYFEFIRTIVVPLSIMIMCFSYRAGTVEYCNDFSHCDYFENVLLSFLFLCAPITFQLSTFNSLKGNGRY